MEPTNILEPSGRMEWRRWLQDNHDSEKECWLMYSETDGIRNIEYIDAVEEALCFGWIDSTSKRMDDVRVQRFSPRRKNSNWTELNKERCRRLIRLGLMTPAGERALPDLDAPFVVDEDIMRTISDDPETYENFVRFPELYVKVRLGNLSNYRKYEEEFERRLKRFLEHTKRNKMYGEWNDKGRLL